MKDEEMKLVSRGKRAASSRMNKKVPQKTNPHDKKSDLN